MRGIFSPPVFANEEQNDRSRNFFIVAWVTTVTNTLFMLGITLADPGLIMRTTVSFAVVASLCLGLLEINRRGWSKAASWILVGGLICLVTMNSLHAGGIRSPGVTMYCVFALMAGLLLGARAGVITAIACAALGFGLASFETIGLLPTQTTHYGVLTYWLLNCLYISVTVLLMRLTTQSVVRAWRRAQSELAERRNVERQRDLALQAGAIGIWHGDLVTREVGADERSFAMLGLPLAPNLTIPMEKWMEAIYRDDLPVVTSTLESLANGQPHARCEYRILRADTGELRHIEATGISVRDEAGKLLRHAGTVMDVTDRKNAEAEREQLVIDIRERMKELQCLYRVLELTTNDSRAIDLICVDIAAVLPPSFLHAEHAVARIVLGTTEHNGKYWSQPREILSSRIVIDGSETGVVEVGYLLECPDLGAGYGAFFKEERALLDGVALHIGRMISNRRTSEFLKHSERIAALGQLTGGIAHDFNNLLQVILGNSEFLSEKLESDTHLQPLAAMTLSAAKRGSDLTNRLLAFSRRQTLTPKRTDLAELVSGMSGLLRRSLGRQVEIDIDSTKELSDAVVDSSQLENAILNLCINARDAMPGGGRLKIALSNIRLERADLAPGEEIPPGDYVLIAVSDTGTGIAPEIIARVFEPFFTTKPPGQGSGLGLSMVFGFMRQSQGCVRVISSAGQGTTIQLYLPAANENDAAETLPQRTRSARGGNESILLVDDDTMVREQVSMQLHALGYRVTATASALDALHLLEGNKDCDLVITDIVMAGLNGYQLAQKISARRPGMPVLFISGFSGDAIAKDASADPNFRLLRKPFGQSELDDSIRQALAGKLIKRAV